jgi:hypothetical protein
MGNLFDIGRPTGAVGGIAAQEEQGRTNRDSDQAFRREKTEFMDYLLDADKRAEERKAAIATAKATQKTADPVAEAAVANAQLSKSRDEEAIQDVTAEQNLKRKQTEVDQLRAEAQVKLVEPQLRQALQKIHYDMSDSQYDQATRAYSGFTEMMQTGMPAEEVYQIQRSQLARILSEGASPEAAEEWLNSNGITADFTDESFRRFAATASFGLHNAPQMRAEHTLEVEYDLRRNIEIIKGQQTKNSNLDVSPFTPNEIQSIGDFVGARITDWDSISGSKDKDTGKYTDNKEKIVAAIASWSHRARYPNKDGDYRTVPVDLQVIATDVINYGKQFIMGSGNWGDKFDGEAFDTAANFAERELNIERNRPENLTIPTKVLWDKIKHRTLIRMDQVLNPQNFIKPEDVVVGEKEEEKPNKRNTRKEFNRLGATEWMNTFGGA